MYRVLIICALFISSTSRTVPDPKEIIREAYYNERSDAYTLAIKINVVRPKWNRELSCKTWAQGAAYGMMMVSAPVKDRGVSFLRIKSEGWNWLPTVERVIKISPSQMSQSWMGSDFTNEDLLKESSIVNDYTHTLSGEALFAGTNCYLIQAIPKSNAAVVWSKKLVWIGKEDLLERKTENYDEDGTLVSTLTKAVIREIGGRKIPTELTMIPHDKTGNKTVVSVLSGDFRAELNANFFTQETMKRLK